MGVRHLDHLNLSVRDFDETVDWYGRVFGFRKVEEAVQDGVKWGVIRAGEALLCIYEHPGLEHRDRFAMKEKGLHHLAHFGLRVDDVADWLAIVEREALTINYGGAIDWPHSRSWYVNDPTGWEIEVSLWNDDTVRFDPPAPPTP